MKAQLETAGESDEGLLRAMGVGSAILLVIGNAIGSGWWPSASRRIGYARRGEPLSGPNRL